MSNRKYEVLYIIRPDLKDDEIKKITDKFKKVVEDHKGTVSSAGIWEKRKLAYEIANLKEGNYVLMNFEAPPELPAELSRLMRISDDVIRHTIFKVDPAVTVAEPPAKSEPAAEVAPVEAVAAEEVAPEPSTEPAAEAAPVEA